MSDHDHTHESSHAHEHHHLHADGTACHCEPTESLAASAQATDPVCGMQVDKEGAEHTAVYAGQTYYFCSGSCRSRFVANPAHYVSA